MTARHPATTTTNAWPPLSPTDPAPTLAEVHATMADPANLPLMELEARVDWMQSGLSPQPDRVWAKRWAWSVEDVGALMTTDWRTRAQLPTCRRGR